MTRILILAGAAFLTSASVSALADNTPASTAAVKAGKEIYDGAGHRLGTVYRLTAQGDPQIILNGKLITIPGSTVSEANGKIQTSMSRADVERGK
jgi:hypothetical protein